MRQKKVVIHVIANFMTGGSSQLVMDIFRDLRNEYEQRVLTSFSPNPPAYVGIPITELKNQCSIESIKSFFSTYLPDLVHVHYWGDCDYSWYDKVISVASGLECKIIENINTPIDPYVSPYIDKYIYVSNYVMEKFGENTMDKAVVVYPGSDFNVFTRRKDNLVPDDCIGMVYRLEKDKLNEQSIDVFIKVVKKRPQTQALIVGGGNFLNLYKNAVAKAGVAKNFIFTDYVNYDRLPSLYEKMSIFVAPVWKESFGQVSPFAMSFGIPVVGYDIGAISEIIGNKNLTAKSDDSGKLSDIICDLLSNRQKRLEIGDFNQKRAAEKFSVEAMTDKYKEIYQEVLSKPFILPEYPPENKGKKRVVLFVHCFFPDHIYGTEVHTYNIAKNLQKLNWDPIIVTAKFPGEKKEKSMVTYYEYDGIPVFCIDKNYLPNKRIRDTYHQEEMRSILRRMLKELEPDMVHATHIINHTSVLYEVLAELDIPCMATMTDFFGHCFNNKLQSFDGKMCIGPNQSRSNCLMCLHAARIQNGSAFSLEKIIIRHSTLAKFECLIAKQFKKSSLAEKITRRVGGERLLNIMDNIEDIIHRPDVLKSAYKNLKCAVVPTRFTEKMYVENGLEVPLHRITFGVDINDKVKKKKTANDSIVIGYIGQIDYHKGTDLLINAFKKAKNNEKAQLLIYGSENQVPCYVNELKSLVRDVSHIYFKGTFPQNQLPDVLSEIDVLVIPSRWYENSPLILLSALAAHTPVIVSDVEGMTEFIIEGENGFSFPINDTNRLSDILEDLINHPDIIAKMQRATYYNKDSYKMTQELVRVYDEVLKEE